MSDVKLTDLLGLGSAASFIFTVIYLSGYSRTLGVDLFFYFSLNDYLRLAIEWLPTTIFILMIGRLVNKFFDRVEQGATEEELAARSPWPRFTKNFRWLGNRLPTVVLVIATLLSIFFHPMPMERYYALWGAAGAALWLELFAWYTKEPKLIQHWTRSWYLFAMYFPALASLVFCIGLTAGKTGTQAFTHPSDMVLLTKNEPIEGRLLFLLDDYIMLRGKSSDSVVIISRADVSRILPSQPLATIYDRTGTDH